MKNRLLQDTVDLMRLPGLSGHEDRVRREIRKRLSDIEVESKTDRLGNLTAYFAGDGPSVMLFAHMDQLGFIVRKIEDNGMIRLARLGGVPERALAAQEILVLGKAQFLPPLAWPGTRTPLVQRSAQEDTGFWGGSQ